MGAVVNRVMAISMGAGALMLLLCAYLLNHGHRELVDARRDAEGARLALQHQTVEAAETRKQLSATEQDLLAKNAVLSAALTEAKAAAPGATPASASEFQTAPEEVEIRRDAEKRADPPAALQANSVAPAVPATGHPQTCALSPGESAWFKVDLIELLTKEQNTLAVGTAELWAQGLDLNDRRVLGPSKFQAQVSQSATLAPPALPRWGAEALVLCGRGGCGPGGGVLLPPWSVLGLRLEARADAALGPEASVLGALGLRW